MDVKTQKKLDHLEETKHLIREAIEEKGQTVTDSDSFRSYADKIASIETGADVSVVTATAPHVLAGDVFVDAQGNPVEGTMPNRGNVRKQLDTAQANFALSAGYYTGGNVYLLNDIKDATPTKEEQIIRPDSGRVLSQVTVAPIPDQYQDVSKVDATEGDVRKGKIFVDALGVERVGTLVVEQKAPDVIWVGKDSVANALVGSGVIRYVTFYNHDGTVTYGQKSVIAGENCVDPVTAGHMETPTRESTAQYNYTFSGGWATEPGGGINADALKNVTEDRTVYANFIAAVRYYTVTIYDEDGTTVLSTESVAYGSLPSNIPKKDGYILTLTPELVAVTGDVSYIASWEQALSFAEASWDYIAAMSESGKASECFKLGDEKIVTLNVSYWGANYKKVSYSAKVPFVIAHFGDHECEDGSIAGITLLSKYPLSEETFGCHYYTLGNGDGPTVGRLNGWEKSNARKACMEHAPQYFPAEVVKHMKAVKKLSHPAGTTTSYVPPSDPPTETIDKIWIPSVTEYGSSYSTTCEGQGFKFDGISKFASKTYGMYQGTLETSYVSHGTRSAHTQNGNNFCVAFNTNGSLTYQGVSYFRMGFCI